ncbi:MAG: FtsX-like permease family protein [Anaerolineae bacterium]|nr:FtsX-like permease family protein [Anaerolineae bacterium]
MLRSRWHKVINDLWGNKIRTFLIVLSIAVGLFAVGTIISARSILSTEMAKSYAAINPSSGTVRTLEPFDQDFVQAVRDMPEVAEADARYFLTARVQTGPDDWANLTVFGVADYNDMRVNKIWPQAGAWPPPDGEILIERAALPVIKANIGDEITMQTADKKYRQLRIAGTVHDLVQMPAQIDSTPYGYVSMKTLEWFGEPYGFNELHIVPANQSDKDHAQDAVNKVKNRAERSGLTIPITMTAEPGQIPMDAILQGILLLMGIIGLLSLFLSVFLIINTISALLAQQRRQIGIMKAVGATTGQIMGMYLGLVLIYGLLALLIAVPLSMAGARELSRFMAAMFNFDLVELATPPQVIVLQIIIGLLTPMLASLPPFLTNLPITPVEAMSAFSLGKGRFGAGLIDRLLSGANLWFARRVLLRPILLSMRNIFRSKWRLTLTLITLTLAGAIFIAVFSMQSSLDTTMDDILHTWDFDIMIIFGRAYRAEKVQRETLAVPGVTATDVWLQLPTRRVRPDGSETKMIYMFAPHAESALVRGPKILQGRWLLPGDENAVVLDSIFMKEERDVKLGDSVVLKVDGRERPFRVVGVGMGMMVPMAYANYNYIAQLTSQVGLADTMLVSTERHDEARVIEISKAIEAQFERLGTDIDAVATLATERLEAEAFFGIIIALLMIMAFMLAIVGGLGLMGTMSINVLERTREIGVLRAIGAPTRGVAWVFIREGMAIGALSWLLSTVSAPFLGKLLTNAVGTQVLGMPFSFTYSLPGVWLWLVMVIILSGLASFIPARNAARLTVREVLAYE